MEDRNDRHRERSRGLGGIAFAWLGLSAIGMACSSAYPSQERGSESEADTLATGSGTESQSLESAEACNYQRVSPEANCRIDADEHVWGTRLQLHAEAYY